MMAGIRSSNTKPEILTRKALHGLGYRYRLGSKIDRIKPDIVLRSRKIAIFVHGCYWHQHVGCRLAYADRDYTEHWKKKFIENNNRDAMVVEKLIKTGWRVAVLWECTTRDANIFMMVMKQLHDWIEVDESQYFENKFRKV